MNRVRLTILLLLAGMAAAAWWLDLGHWLSLEVLHQRIGEMRALAAGAFPEAALAFFAAYVGLTALSVPGAALTLTLAAGALFGIGWGTLLVSFASALGATLACLLARFLLRDYVERRFATALARINAGFVADGGYYLFGLRLVPLFPFFVINLAMGLTRLPLHTFYWVSQLGMLPATLVFVNAGTRLAEIGSVRDVLSPGVASSFALLGIFPLLARRAAGALLAWHRRTRGPG